MNKDNKMAENSPAGAGPGRIDHEEIRKLIALLEEKNLALFELEIEGFKIKISRAVPAAVAAAPAAVPTVVPAAAVEPKAAAVREAARESDKNLHAITSPMVGTLYRAPDPTAAPFVDLGDTVRKGQTLCIIEAMKLMNEIESDVDGVVAEILAENAKPVEFGQRLFIIQAGA
jgi:acetyl-CoA carboxylase biotin carboxyl carrier protein